MKQLSAFCESQRDWVLDAVDALVRLESPTSDKAAVDRCGAEVARRLATLGGRVRIHERPSAGSHVLAEFGGDGRPILLLGHLDTVWPVGELARRPFVVRDGLAFGPGVFDMKAAIAVALLAVRALQEQPPGRIPSLAVLLTSDGNFTAALGVPTLDGLGPEGDGAHAIHEHVVVDRLAARAALLAGLVVRLGGRQGG